MNIEKIDNIDNIDKDRLRSSKLTIIDKNWQRLTKIKDRQRWTKIKRIDENRPKTTKLTKIDKNRPRSIGKCKDSTEIDKIP